MAARTATRQMLPTAEAAAYCGLAPQTLRNLRNVGTGPDYVGERSGIRYDTRDLDAWLESRKTRHPRRTQ